MTLDDKELIQIQHRVENCPAISGSPQLSALLKYLWEHRHERARPKAIWEEGGLKKLCRAKDKDTKGFKYEENVRTAVADLRRILKSYFVAEGNADIWHIELPPIIPGTGYKLECFHVATEFKYTAAFWQPHLKGDRQISIVYAEQFFFTIARKVLFSVTTIATRSAATRRWANLICYMEVNTQS